MTQLIHMGKQAQPMAQPNVTYCVCHWHEQQSYDTLSTNNEASHLALKRDCEHKQAAPAVGIGTNTLRGQT